jgi:hypothetical protein
VALDSLVIPNTLHRPVDVMRASKTSGRMFGTLRIVRANIERYDTVAMSDSSYDSVKVVRMCKREWEGRESGSILSQGWTELDELNAVWQSRKNQRE